MKKKRTAKQKAATRKLVALNKKSKRVSKTPTKVITKTRRHSVMKRKSMSKRRTSKSMFGKGLLSKGLGIANHELVNKRAKGNWCSCNTYGYCKHSSSLSCTAFRLYHTRSCRYSCRWICRRHSCNCSFILR